MSASTLHKMHNT